MSYFVELYKKLKSQHIYIVKNSSGDIMLSFHSIDDLKGKVAPSILEKYNVEYENYMLASIIAGFHRSFGLKNEGNAISLEITYNICEDTLNLLNKNLLIWNLYVLTDEYIKEYNYDEALKFIEKMETIWSRDVLLGDDIGVYHVSWLEQILLKKAEAYLLTGNVWGFEEVTDKILWNRLKFFSDANKKMSISPLHDRCIYTCLELMASMCRKENIDTAVMILKQALLYKTGPVNYRKLKNYIESKSKKDYLKKYNMYLRCFNRVSDYTYDYVKYGYCSTCKFYDNSNCRELGIITSDFKACSKYE